MTDVLPFVLARLNETEERLRDSDVTRGAGEDSYRLLVTTWDMVSVLRTLALTARDNDVITRRIALVISQPWEQHPDFDPAWLDELADLMKGH